MRASCGAQRSTDIAVVDQLAENLKPISQFAARGTRGRNIEQVQIERAT
jgi:hypothetical protein